MSIELKNNKLYIQNLSWNTDPELAIEDWQLKVNANNSVNKEGFITTLNNLYDDLNEQQKLFNVAAVISNNNSQNYTKLSIQKEMLDNRFEKYTDYETQINQNLKYSTIVEKIENVSSEYLSLYENIDSMISNVNLSKFNFGNTIINYFAGNKSYKIGKIIYWSNLPLNIDYDNINNSSLNEESKFLSSIGWKFYDFKNYISNENKQDKFIVNDLLIDQTNFSRNPGDTEYLANTTEIVGQSLFNVIRSLYFPIHTSCLVNSQLQDNAFEYHNNLNKTKNISKLSNYPTVKNHYVPDYFYDSDEIANYSNGIDLINPTVSSTLKIISNEIIQKDIHDNSSLNYYKKKSTKNPGNLRTYLRAFRNHSYLLFQMRRRNTPVDLLTQEQLRALEELGRPTPEPGRIFNGQTALEDGLLQPNVVSPDNQFIANLRSELTSGPRLISSLEDDRPVDPIKVSFLACDSNFFKTYENSGLLKDTKVIRQFYNIKSEYDFKFSCFFETINLNRLYIKIFNLFNKLKLKVLKDKNVDLSSLKTFYKNISRNNSTLVIGNSLSKGMLNFDFYEDNIFYSSNNYFYNDFSQNLHINNEKIKNTILLNESLGSEDLESVRSFKENFDLLVTNYYPDNFMKNSYEFFMKIYSDLHRQKLINHLNTNFDYDRDIFYFKTLLNKKNTNNIANTFLAKVLSDKLNISLENSLLDESSEFNIDIIYDGKESDLLKVSNSAIVLNDAFAQVNSETSPRQTKIYSMFISTAGIFFILAAKNNRINEELFEKYQHAVENNLEIRNSEYYAYIEEQKNKDENVFMKQLMGEELLWEYYSLNILGELDNDDEYDYLYNNFTQFIEEGVLESENVVKTQYENQLRRAEIALENKKIRAVNRLIEEFEGDLGIDSDRVLHFIETAAQLAADPLDFIGFGDDRDSIKTRFNRRKAEVINNIIAANIPVELVAWFKTIEYFAKVIFNYYQAYRVEGILNEQIDFVEESFSPVLPTRFSGTKILPFPFNARISKLVFAEYNIEEEEWSGFNESKDNNNDINFTKNQDGTSLYHLNNRSNPVLNVYQNEKQIRNSVFLENNSSIFDVIFDTIHSVLMSLVKEEDLENIKSQDDITSFVSENKEIVEIVKNLIAVYADLFNPIVDKVFHKSLLSFVLKPYSSQPVYTLTELENISFYEMNFKKCFLEEVNKNARLFKNINENSLIFKNIIESNTFNEIIPQSAGPAESLCTINDFLLVKLVNLLKRSDITRSAYFDIVYSYLEDTLDLDQKLSQVNLEIEEKVSKINSLAPFVTEPGNIVELGFSDSTNLQLLKNYYENSIKHIFVKEKIRELKEKENVSFLNLSRDVMKTYHDKKYAELSANISGLTPNNAEETLVDEFKDIICLTISNNAFENLNPNTIYKISISLADHVRPDMFVYEKDFFYSPLFSSNSKIKSTLSFSNSLQGFQDVVFNSNLTNETVAFFNNKARLLKDKISLIDQASFKKIVLEKLQNIDALTPSQKDMLTQKMFSDYIKSGKYEQILKEFSSFPDKTNIFTNDIYKEEVIGEESLDLLNNLSDNIFLGIFNERKQEFLRNINPVSDGLNSTLYNYEEIDKNTNVYSFIKSYDQFYTNIDITKIIENKTYYDFFFIEVSPDDFLYRPATIQPEIVFRTNEEGSNNKLFNYIENIDTTDKNNFDYKIRGISSGLKRKRELVARKNNYNYVIKVEELK